MGKTNNQSAIQSFWEGLRPRARLNIAEWADKNRFLSSKASPEPGLWRTSRVPFMREIMEMLSPDSPVQKVVVMKGAQLAATEVGLNFMGHTIDEAPAPFLLVMGTVEVIKTNTLARINPMIEASPSLSLKIPPNSKKAGENNLYEKSFPGGGLYMRGANSGSGMRSMPIKNLMLDEVDSYPANLEGEGSPVALAEARTSNFANKKIYILSTPKLKNTSLIEQEFSHTDKRQYHIPCPHCGLMQVLVWANMQWELTAGNPTNPKRVWYKCEGCEKDIEEWHKRDFLERGKWIATDPEKASSELVGYQISSMYCPLGWYSWKQMVTEYLKALTDENKMIGFWNLRLGLPYEASGDMLSFEEIRNKAEDYPRNKPDRQVVLLTMGVDVQRDRLELEIVGWGRNKESWSIDYRQIMGAPAEEEVWQTIDKIMQEEFIREDGTPLKISLAAVDSSDNTARVYEIVARYPPSKMVAIKGRARNTTIFSTPKKVDTDSDGRRVAPTLLYSIGTDILKSELFGRLALSRTPYGTYPSGYCHFPQSYPIEYFKGLASEKLDVTKNRFGHFNYNWVKTYRRNEPLDCRNYARAAAAILGYDHWAERDFEAIERFNILGDQANKPAKKPKNTSEFWG